MPQYNQSPGKGVLAPDTIERGPLGDTAGVCRRHYFKHIDFIPAERAKVWVAAALAPKMVCEPNTAREDESGTEGKSTVGGIC